MLFCFYYVTQTAMFGGFFWVLLGAEGNARKKQRLGNSSLCIKFTAWYCELTATSRWNKTKEKTPVIPSHCCNKIQASALHFILQHTAASTTYKQDSGSSFPKNPGRPYECLSPRGYKSSHKLFHYTVRKDIFTILKEQAKAWWLTLNCE